MTGWDTVIPLLGAGPTANCAVGCMMEDDLDGRLCHDGLIVAFERTGEGGGTAGVVSESRRASGRAFLGLSCTENVVTFVLGVVLTFTPVLSVVVVAVDEAVVPTAVVWVVVAMAGSGSWC